MTLQLLLDASGAEAWVGLADDGVLVARASSAVRASHGEALLPLLVQVLGTHAPRDLAQLVVGVGPGSFTGIRVALATALGLRRAVGVPVVTVSTFECLVAAHPEPRGALVVTVPALPGEVYAERWKSGAPESEAWLCPEDELPAGYTRVAGVTSLEAMLDAGRGKSPADELLPRYVAPPKITLPKPRGL